MRFYFSLLLAFGWGCLTMWSQTATPKMTYIDEDGKEREETSFSGSAPFVATFSTELAEADGYTPRYEWQFFKGSEAVPFLLRYDPTTTYEFKESGNFRVRLLVSFIMGTDTVEYISEEPFSIVISESSLDFPNAFTPNGDGVNDVLRAKPTYKSITDFRALIFSRSGKLLFEWSDPSLGWDGTQSGTPVPDGAYYLQVVATGADGRKYHIKKVVNLLRKNLRE